MSGYAYQWAKRQRVGDGPTKSLLKTYAHWASEDYTSWVTNEELESDLEMDIKTIRKCRKKLVDLGFLMETEGRKGETRSIVVYQMLAPADSVIVQAWNPRTEKMEVLGPPYRHEIDAKGVQKRSPSKSGGSKTLQIRSPSENGAPPETPGSPSTFTGKPLQIRPEAPPNLEGKKGLEEQEKAGEEKTLRLAPPVSEGADKTATAKDKTAEPDTITLQALVAEGVNRQHAKDWLTARKKKQRPLTLTAWDDVKAEAVKAGMTPAAAVEMAAKNSWAGFRAGWLTEGKQGSGAAAAVDTEWHLSMDGIKRRGVELRVKPQQDGEDFLQFKARVFKAAGQGPWIDKLLAEWRGTESVFLSLTAYFNDLRPGSAAA
ncbi:hypothetical protein OVY01_20900 [Robbsia sp. Bb-Pol-6]|uniref:Uncharacterized protein n=1 Tax=Robbsia betulipollinis TaxID=2981849 RepID=A0ABT3ZSR3_9BURK|nr:hypothetical protein [Robbsia betulipollinis]MCY0389609.1 hypothetical protein [Robbsia betulipollinis]